MTRNDSFQCCVDFSVCGGKKKQKIMYKSAKNAAVGIEVVPAGSLLFLLKKLTLECVN